MSQGYNYSHIDFDPSNTVPMDNNNNLLMSNYFNIKNKLAK